MKHLKGINQKAARIEAYVEYEAAEARAAELDVVDSSANRHTKKMGRTSRWDARSSSFRAGKRTQQGGTAGLCQPVERDLFDCHLNCFWPAHVPDQLNHAPDWTGKCASAQKDWRKIDLIFP